MSTIKIRRGLRRLEFSPSTGHEQHGSHVVVEFVMEAQLERDQVVNINLGVRSGIDRILQGVPRIIDSGANRNGTEFLYRLEGEVP